ncbi:pyrroloquinoline quinone biosynthesis peptide chaperone PqqD [Mesorhizobium sp. LHD-90]|uniref:pyrroloquinoline quinone biosynthesis peptide chaperone PqqD n=1 Tax=Mesorhizobium sp. LHD-90 TaxID=3071414 RepID=UPI0027DFB870|nr:pyrroloquinoline quinone biosynthesis peptide chaperone PqqD [Mesorhizobium sp. LHD-90]MDQ6435378.1 pyrroloquinoline quinone biosynthesis peptide chaperone PqqD [Mesorhizobium sp. LHD-90]
MTVAFTPPPSPATLPRARALVSPHSIPALPRHVRIQYDPVRQADAVLAPEKVFWPNDISLDILRRCDGSATVSQIVAGLAAEYDAPEADVAADVETFLQEWSDKLLVKL